MCISSFELVLSVIKLWPLPSDHNWGKSGGLNIKLQSGNIVICRYIEKTSTSKNLFLFRVIAYFILGDMIVLKNVIKAIT